MADRRLTFYRGRVWWTLCILLVALGVTLTGCGKPGGSTTKDNGSQTQPVATEAIEIKGETFESALAVYCRDAEGNL